MMRVATLCLCAAAAYAQDFTQRGFLETQLLTYPQTVPWDRGHFVGESLFRYEASRAVLPGLRLYGAFDARADSHRQTERRWRLDWKDRSLRRPALSMRRLSAVFSRGGFTFEAGKQFVRWGKTDILNPTDRFAPRDFLSVVRNEFLPVSAVRTTLERGAHSLDLVWQPLFTPSRIPLLNQRWVVLPSVPFEDHGSRYPGGSAFGARLNRLGRGYEASLSFYDGHNHLPLFDAKIAPSPYRVELFRFYPHLRMFGGDTVISLPWLTVKAEAAWFGSRSDQADEYVLYVGQLERQIGEWSFVGGYAGEAVTKRRNPFDFAPDRGLTDALLGRADYTIGPTRTVAFEGAVRRNGGGTWLRVEYSQGFGAHWRAVAGMAVIRGDATDFLGQYRRNSHATLVIRYSF